jgi:hypothetical protein
VDTTATKAPQDGAGDTAEAESDTKPAAKAANAMAAEAAASVHVDIPVEPLAIVDSAAAAAPQDAAAAAAASAAVANTKSAAATATAAATTAAASLHVTIPIEAPIQITVPAAGNEKTNSDTEITNDQDNVAYKCIDTTEAEIVSACKSPSPCCVQDKLCYPILVVSEASWF